MPVFLIVREFDSRRTRAGTGAAATARTAQPAQHRATARPARSAWWRGRLRIPQRELALIGYSHRAVRHREGRLRGGRAAVPARVLLLLALTSGSTSGIIIPSAVGLVLAVLFFFLVDVSIRQQAAEAREEFSRHVAVYLDLIALELAASRGPTEALERAAAVGGGWVSPRIRETLENSRLRLEPPWEGLEQVAAEIGVPDLGDVGDIMTLAGDEGAQVYDTLRSRAESRCAPPGSPRKRNAPTPPPPCCTSRPACWCSCCSSSPPTHS